MALGAGLGMPVRRAWADFLLVHRRPHLLVVNIGIPTDSASGKKLVDLLLRLIESLRSAADYAILIDLHEVKIVFERDLDAAFAGGLLGSRIVKRGGDEWASESICDFGLH